MNLKTIKGFQKTEEAAAFAKQVELRAAGAEIFANDRSAAAPSLKAPTL